MTYWLHFLIFLFFFYIIILYLPTVLKEEEEGKERWAVLIRMFCLHNPLFILNSMSMLTRLAIIFHCTNVKFMDLSDIFWSLIYYSSCPPLQPLYDLYNMLFPIAFPVSILHFRLGCLTVFYLFIVGDICWACSYNCMRISWAECFTMCFNCIAYWVCTSTFSIHCWVRILIPE